MIIERREGWGILQYDTLRHRFSYKNNENEAIPYAQSPVVLNCDLTMKCNMACEHCVTKDFTRYIDQDLVTSTEMIKWINESPFMVVVITGGEPFLAGCENKLITLLRQIEGKGLIIDTNGTITPNKSVIDSILKTHTLIRVSWDSIRPQDEICLRHKKRDTLRNREINKRYYYKKVEMIKSLRSQSIDVAVQTVVHKKNLNSIIEMPSLLHEYSIKQWYIQRLIPSHLIADKGSFRISDSEYNKIITKLVQKCSEKEIECITKKDRRHNCVFLLVGNGLLYTQGEKLRQKILLGNIRSTKIRYFYYVSSSEHSVRYYG